MAAAACGRAAGRHEQRSPAPPPELIDAWRTRQYGLPYAGGWKNQTAGSLEKMNHALNVYTALEKFEDRGDMTEVEFSRQYFDLWRLVIDVEQLERGDHA